MRILPKKKINSEIKVPADKSISHRCLLFPSIADEESTVHNLLESADVISTYSAMRKIGICFEGDFKKLKIIPKHVKNLEYDINCGNSGTTARIITGLFAGIKGKFHLHGDESLSKRPMGRVTNPLGRMGVKFTYKKENGFLPLEIEGIDNLTGVDFYNSNSSAQVKSAILLAGLKANGITRVEEPVKSRDHTERMLKTMGVKVEVAGNSVSVRKSNLHGIEMTVPGDFSSAAFFIVLGLVHPNCRIKLKNVSLNPTRTGLLGILDIMGGKYEISNVCNDNEPFGDIYIETSDLKGCTVPENLIPSCIDELPLLALLGANAEGETIMRNAGELRVKESDRIKTVCEGMREIGVDVKELDDGFCIMGKQKIPGGEVETYGDHRMAMLFSLCGLVSEDGVKVKDHYSVNISFPSFFDILDNF